MKRKILAVLLLAVLWLSWTGGAARAQTPSSVDPNKGWIAFIGQDNNLWLVQPDGTQQRQITIDASKDVRYSLPKWSPDGQKLAFLRQEQSAGDWLSKLYYLRSADFEKYPDSPIMHNISQTAGGFDWFSDSKRIIYDGPVVYSADDRGCPTRPTRYEPLHIFNVDTVNVEIVALPKESGPIFVTSLSPDDKRLIFRKDQNATMYQGQPFFVSTLDQQSSSTPLEKSYESCKWSPDSGSIACDTWDAKNCGIGMDAKCAITQYTADGQLSAFSPLLTSTMKDPDTGQYLFDLHPTWSPDGKYLAVTTSDGFFFADGPCMGGSGPSVSGMIKAVYLFTASDFSRRRVTSGVFSGWSPDGKYILVSEGGSGRMDKLVGDHNLIFVVNAETGTGTGQAIADGYDAAWQPVIRPDPVSGLIARPGSKGGQVQFRWTMPATREGIPQVTALDIRYSDQPISDDTWDTPAVLKLWNIPQPGAPGKEQTQEILFPNLPPYKSWYFAVKTVDARGVVSKLSNVTWVIDTGFRPETDGFNFCNGTKNLGEGSYRQCGLQWERYPLGSAEFTLEQVRQMMQDDSRVCWSVENGECHPFKSVETWLALKGGPPGGHCYGMDTVAQQFIWGDDGALKILQTEKETINAIDFEKVVAEISFQHFHQYFDPVKTAVDYETLRDNPPLDVLEAIKANLASGDKPEPSILVMMQKPHYDEGKLVIIGHSLTPYAISYDGPEKTILLHVYDTNYRYDPKSRDQDKREIPFHEDTGEWMYIIQPDLPQTTKFDEIKCSEENCGIGLIPAALHNEKKTSPWAEPGETDLMTVGYANMLITDSAGNTTGYKDGDYVNNIPGAAIHTYIDATGPEYSLPSSGAYTIQISGNPTGENSAASLAQFGAGYATAVEDIPVTASTKDTLMISPDGTKIVYQSSEDKTAAIVMALDGKESSYEFKVTGLPLRSSGLTSIEANLSGGQLIIKNQQNAEGTYDLQIRATNAQGEQAVTYPDISLAAGSTHVFDISRWTPKDPLKLSVDKNGDGKYDQVRHLASDGGNEGKLPVLTITLAAGSIIMLAGLGLMAWSFQHRLIRS